MVFQVAPKMAMLSKKVVRLEDVADVASEKPESLFGMATASDEGNSHKGSPVNTAYTGVTSGQYLSAG